MVNARAEMVVTRAGGYRTKVYGPEEVLRDLAAQSPDIYLQCEIEEDLDIASECDNLRGPGVVRINDTFITSDNKFRVTNITITNMQNLHSCVFNYNDE